MAVYLLPSWLATAPLPPPPPPPPLLMDSPSTASDDEDHHQGSDGGKKKPRHVMFLVSHMEAGCIIGKDGSIVKSMESHSGARINISRHNQLFPGTTSRVVLVSGLFNQLMDAMELILERLVYQGDQVIDSQATIALVVPSVCCGALIGKGGATLKAITQKASAGIKISPQDNSYGLHDRLVTITGSLDNQLRAIFLVLSKLLEDVLYSIPIARIVFSSYPASPAEYENDGSDEHVGRYQNKPNTPVRSPDKNDGQEYLTIAIADEHIGAVIGRAGRSINEITQVSGACIRISAKGDFIADTCDRQVVISGTPEAIQAAEAMIMHRVSAAGRLSG